MGISFEALSMDSIQDGESPVDAITSGTLLEAQ